MSEPRELRFYIDCDRQMTALPDGTKRETTDEDRQSPEWLRLEACAAQWASDAAAERALMVDRIAEALRRSMSRPGYGYIDFTWHLGDDDHEIRDLAEGHR